MNAIELAENIEKIYPDLSYKTQMKIAAELRRLHAENESLKAGMKKQANAVTLMRSVVGETAKHNAEQNVIVELSQLRSQLESECEANSQLTAENEAMRKDAARYQWLRHLPTGMLTVNEFFLVTLAVRSKNGFSHNSARHETLDEAIDKAMSQAK